MAALRTSPLERGKGSVTPLESNVQVMLLVQHPSSSPQGENVRDGDLGVSVYELQNDNVVEKPEKRKPNRTCLQLGRKFSTILQYQY